jgi:PAS domain-containing protein
MSQDRSSLAQKGIELILMRELASHLGMPIFIVDGAGALLFYNEQAERLLGRPYAENGELPLEEWTSSFRPRREDGQTVGSEDLPLAIAVREKRPAYLSPLVITGPDEVTHKIAVAAFPLQGLRGHQVGAVAIFWEV